MRSFFVFRISIVCLTVLGVGIFFSAPVHAADTQFFIDSSYDDSGRTQVSATDILDSDHAHFYIEESFLSSLSAEGKQQLSYYTQKIAHDFDSTIYPNETYVFGNEWKPGIDNDLKIYILLTPMRDSAGGYFRPQDEQPISQVPDSNQREILYLNAHLVAFPHLREFLAHEFQHLINYNQKTRLRGVQEDVWLNEMMSEAAPMVAGVYQEPDFSFEKSNIHDRVTTFLASPNDDVLDWNESVEDYASIALLGDYLYEHYGAQLFTDLEQSDTTGIAALDEALQGVGAHKTFEQVFSDWTMAVILNDCSIAPQNLYCYTDAFLNYDNLHIQFRKTQVSDSQVSFKQQTQEWAGNWFRYMQSAPDASSATGTGMPGQATAGMGQAGTENSSTPKPGASPPGTYLNFSFAGPSGSTEFSGAYVIYGADGTKKIYPIAFGQGTADWSVAGFGTNATQVDVMFSDFFHKQMTRGNPFLVSYVLDATLDTKPNAATSAGSSLAMAGSLLHDGDLIRIIGDSKIYVLKGNYRRWIRSAAIFNSYGDLHWNNVKEVSADEAERYKDSSLVERAGDPRVFTEYVDGTKHWVKTQKAFLNHGYSWDSIFIINEKEFNLLPLGKAITS